MKYTRIFLKGWLTCYIFITVLFSHWKKNQTKNIRKSAGEKVRKMYKNWLRKTKCAHQIFKTDTILKPRRSIFRQIQIIASEVENFQPVQKYGEKCQWKKKVGVKKVKKKPEKSGREPDLQKMAKNGFNGHFWLSWKKKWFMILIKLRFYRDYSIFLRHTKINGIFEICIWLNFHFFFSLIK